MKAFSAVGSILIQIFHPEKQGAFFSLDGPYVKAGDRTVPISSATALRVNADRTFEASDINHQGLYTNKKVQDATVAYVQQILDRYLKAEAGCYT